VIVGCSQKSMQILTTRSKVNLRRFYENFTSNKQCESYGCDKWRKFPTYLKVLKVDGDIINGKYSPIIQRLWKLIKTSNGE
jgi:hypothetical protein